MSRRPSDIDPFAGPSPVPFSRPLTADSARREAPPPAPVEVPPILANAPPAPTLPPVTESVDDLDAWLKLDLSGKAQAAAGEELVGRPKFEQELQFLIRARYSLLFVLTAEERRAEEAILSVANARQMKVFTWSVTDGMKLTSENGGDWNASEYKDPNKALQFVLDRDVRGLFILKDPHPYYKNPEFARKLRDVAHRLKDSRKNVIILSSVMSIPQEMEKEMAVVELPHPDQREISLILQKTASDALNAHADRVEHVRTIRASIKGERERERIIDAALGLTALEAENVFSKSLVDKKAFDVQIILAEKERIVRKSGILEFFPTMEKMENIGGLDHLKDWLEKRQSAFGREATAFGLPRPKGILMLGIPGCGKSLTAKAVGSYWQLPLLRLDMGRVFAGIVGSSEENMRRAIGMAEAVAPSILWLDELEKGLSGTQSSGSTDGGTSARVFGSFISWMQEKKTPVFVMATANDVSQLPPELMRKGRFDEIFFVDLPTLPERKDIFKIHVRKRSTVGHVRQISDEEAAALADISDGFSGAEIEQAVVSAMFDAFYKREELTAAHIHHAVTETVPLARTMKEKIAELRLWCRSRARPASSAYTEAKSSNERKLEL